MLAAGAVMLTGCHGPEVACPAIAYGSTLVVRLAADWPPGQGRTVQVDCGEPCTPLFPAPTEGAPASTAQPTLGPVPVTGSEVRLVMLRHPDSVTVTVLGPGGPLASVQDVLAWRRVGGSAECGGPMQATVVVPAPA